MFLVISNSEFNGLLNLHNMRFFRFLYKIAIFFGLWILLFIGLYNIIRGICGLFWFYCTLFFGKAKATHLKIFEICK